MKFDLSLFLNDNVLSKHQFSCFSSFITPNFSSIERIYDITKKDIQKLKKIMALFWNPIIDEFLPISKQVNHIFIALEMYNNAFLNTGPFEGRIRFYQSQIAYLMSALEALFLPKVPNKSITFTLKTRISLILKYFEYDFPQCKKNIGDAYDIRSLYYHASKRKSKLRTFNRIRPIIEEFTNEIFNYARISILVFLGLAIIKSSQKDDFLALIDESLSDDTKAEELKDKIKKLNPKLFIEN